MHYISKKSVDDFEIAHKNMLVLSLKYSKYPLQRVFFNSKYSWGDMMVWILIMRIWIFMKWPYGYFEYSKGAVMGYFEYPWS